MFSLRVYLCVFAVEGNRTCEPGSVFNLRDLMQAQKCTFICFSQCATLMMMMIRALRWLDWTFSAFFLFLNVNLDEALWPRWKKRGSRCRFHPFWSRLVESAATPGLLSELPR